MTTTASGARKRAAIYCRISQDRTGEAAGVDRQERECRELAGQLGLDVVTVFTDNDLTAFKGSRRYKGRPKFDQLLAAVRERRVDAVISWHSDRLLRDMGDLETYITACRITDTGDGVPTHTVRSGRVDLSNASGRMMARILAAVQQQEVEHMIERAKSAKKDGRDAGVWAGGPRPFGYAVVPLRDAAGNTVMTKHGAIKHTITPDPVEGAAVAEGYRRLLAGGPENALGEIARDWTAAGLRTPKGGTFTHESVRAVLLRATNAGLIEYPAYRPGKGKIVGEHNWGALTDESTYRAARGILNDPARRTSPGPKPRHLLTGILVCGVCGGTKFAVMPVGPRRHVSYVCASASIRGDGKPRTRACVGRSQALLDALAERLIIAKLREPGAARAFADPEVDVAELDARRSALTAELDDWARQAGITPRQLQIRSEPLIAEMEEIEKQLARALQGTALEPFAGDEDPEDVWDRLPIGQRRAVAADILRIIVRPSRAGRKHPPGWKPGDPHDLDLGALTVTSPDGTPWGETQLTPAEPDEVLQNA